MFLDVEPPVVDYCESPPEFITDTEDVEIDWDKPIFHDNSRYDHEHRDIDWDEPIFRDNSW